MNDYDRAYYELRGAKSRQLAALAGDPKIAAAHLITAGRYDAIALSKGGATRRGHRVLGG